MRQLRVCVCARYHRNYNGGGGVVATQGHNKFLFNLNISIDFNK